MGSKDEEEKFEYHFKANGESLIDSDEARMSGGSSEISISNHSVAERSADNSQMAKNLIINWDLDLPPPSARDFGITNTRTSSIAFLQTWKFHRHSGEVIL
jgi:hypothetical protein